MKLTVYLPCFNGERTLAESLDAISHQSRPADEVLVVDDGSTDASGNISRRFGHYGVRVLAQPGNLGLAAARNQALRESNGDILVGLDVDVAPAPDYLECVEDVFNTLPHVGAICGR